MNETPVTTKGVEALPSFIASLSDAMTHNAVGSILLIALIVSIGYAARAWKKGRD